VEEIADKVTELEDLEIKTFKKKKETEKEIEGFKKDITKLEK